MLLIFVIFITEIAVNNKSTSLKALETSMNYPNVMEMPISHTKEDITLEEVEQVLEYNLNDVEATYEFYLKSLGKIELRKSLSKQYNLNCINYSDSKIGESLILKLYCDKTGLNPYEVSKMRTYRPQIALNDVILPYIQFESKEFTNLLNKFKNTTIIQTKGAIEESVIYEGFKYVYGTGGIHGCIKPGVYEFDEDYVIMDCDVGSLYPNLGIVNNFYIEHLGPVFIEVYKDMVAKRMIAKKEGNTLLADGFKLAANSVYGKSNDEYSFLYDPKYTMAITLNGQLLLTMLCEQLVNNFPLQLLQINTDGITIKLHKKYLDNYYQICKDWESKTKLGLEYAEYSKMVIADVNNYSAITTTGKIKQKGRFEVNKVVGSEPAYHKDNSFKVIPLAIQEYFVNNTPIQDTIYNHNKIYDFCGRQKFTKDSYGCIHLIDKDSHNNAIHAIRRQQKNVRYYISTNGNTFIKHYNTGELEAINKGYQVTVFNQYIEKPIRDYNINYNFYILQTQKEINNIISTQIEMF